MTDKQRVRRALEGRPVHRVAVTSLYHHLYHQDHFAELTGRPQWQLWEWMYAEPAEHLETYKAIVQLTPFDILQPQTAHSREARENTEVIERDGQYSLRDRRSDALTSLDAVSGHPTDTTANQTQYVFDKTDADERVVVTPAHDLLATGSSDYAQAAVEALGEQQFIMAGGLTGTLWSCHWDVGLTNLLVMLVAQPDLIDYLSKKHLARSIETIRALAAVGGDAIYIDDAMGTCDMISVAHYERFCLPYVTEMVREVRRLGHKAIIIYFGGIADRLQQIASIGADGLSMETSMKGYVNDIGEIASAIGDRVTLFGNLDPIDILQNGSDGAVEREFRRQADAARTARGFIACTGSPITPGTPLPRVQRFIELGRLHKSRSGDHTCVP